MTWISGLKVRYSTLIVPPTAMLNCSALWKARTFGASSPATTCRKEMTIKAKTYDMVCAALISAGLSPNSAKMATKVESVSVLIVSMPTAPRPSETRVMPTWVTE